MFLDISNLVDEEDLKTHRSSILCPLLELDTKEWWTSLSIGIETRVHFHWKNRMTSVCSTKSLGS